MVMLHVLQQTSILGCSPVVHFHLNMRRCSRQTSYARTVAQSWVCQIIIGFQFSVFAANRFWREFCLALGNRSSGFEFPHHMSLYCTLMSSAGKCAPGVAQYAGIVPVCTDVPVSRGIGVYDRLLQCVKAPEVAILIQWAR
jgi:hypothetical protein